MNLHVIFLPLCLRYSRTTKHKIQLHIIRAKPLGEHRRIRPDLYAAVTGKPHHPAAVKIEYPNPVQIPQPTQDRNLSQISQFLKLSVLRGKKFQHGKASAVFQPIYCQLLFPVISVKINHQQLITDGNRLICLPDSLSIDADFHTIRSIHVFPCPHRVPDRSLPELRLRPGHTRLPATVLY